MEILDPTFDQTAWQPARRRRLLLAGYIDFLLFSSAWGLLVFAFQDALPILAELPGYAKFVTFSVVEAALLRTRTWSPGAELLGVRFFAVRDRSAPIDQLWQGRVPYVSNEQKSRESWYTLALAIFIINDACKTLVRWTMWNPPMPFFGQPLGELTGAVIYLLSGAIGVYVAVQLFRVDVRGALVGALAGVGQAVSASLSWDLWDPWVAEQVTRRRAFQGFPVRDGEIEQMQAVMPELLIAGSVVLVVLLLAAIPRLRAHAGPPIEHAP